MFYPVSWAITGYIKSRSYGTCRELDFSYPNHFARLFRQKTGMSPSAFRKQLLKE
ncbi:AraC family transcriptional regulator [Segatella copri]|uniref:AraC family transcriptional regulator n=1 Tax=Segatella copri TaxID=165179 RepID=UPI003D0022F5